MRLSAGRIGGWDDTIYTHLSATVPGEHGMLMLLDEAGAAPPAHARGGDQRPRKRLALREHIALLGHALAATQVDSYAEAEQGRCRTRSRIPSTVGRNAKIPTCGN